MLETLNSQLMSLTTHFIDKEWKSVQVVLNVKAMSESHVAQYIRGMFLEMLDEWAINSSCVVLVLRDSGANMVKAMKIVDMPGLSCSAHTLQLVVKDGLAYQRGCTGHHCQAEEVLLTLVTLSLPRGSWPLMSCHSSQDGIHHYMLKRMQ